MVIAIPQSIPGVPHLANPRAAVGILRANGWTIAERLLERWFNAPPNNNPLTTQPDTTTVTMRWVLGFHRAGIALHRMIHERVWLEQPARDEIAKLLKTLGKLGRQRTSFGNLNHPVPTLDKNYIQHRRVGNLITDPVDELFAALARFAFRVAVAGTVAPGVPGNRPVHTVAIEEVGIYVRDSFDFNGEQFLGCWNPRTNQVQKLPGRGFYQLTNEDFRNWRTHHGRGGDYLVLSDMVRLRRTPPETFDIGP